MPVTGSRRSAADTAGTLAGRGASARRSSNAASAPRLGRRHLRPSFGAPGCVRAGKTAAFHAEAAAIASVTGRPVRASATRSWFEDDGAGAPVDGLRERFGGSCERIAGSDVDVELALRERRGEQA